jgi:hypothetical protein
MERKNELCLDKNERFLRHLKYYLIPNSDKSNLGIVQPNCNVKNQTQLQTCMEISSGFPNHAFKHFNILLICYFLNKFAQSGAAGPLYVQPVFVSFSSFSLFSISRFFNYIYFPFFFYLFFFAAYLPSSFLDVRFFFLLSLFYSLL